MPLAIERHSPSSLNLFAAEPAMWVLERLLGIKQPVGVPAHRGVAVESGVAYGLLHPEADYKTCNKQAFATYDALTALSGDERRDKYRRDIPEMVEPAIDEMRPYGIPSDVQGFITWQPDGLKYPIVGYYDFMWKEQNFIVDLKSTERMPSNIKVGHARQVSLYSMHNNSEGFLCYVTPKKINMMKLENPAEHRQALYQLAKAGGKLPGAR